MTVENICEYIRTEFEYAGEVNETTKLTELSKDSLDLFQMIMHIEKCTGKQIDITRLDKNTTIKNLFEILSADERKDNISYTDGHS